MSRNRRNQSAAVRFGPALKAILICAAIGGVGVGYVWHKTQVVLLGRKIVEGEKRLEQLTRENRELEKQSAYLKSPAVLKSLIMKHNLNLGMTHPDQVLLLQEPRDGSRWQSMNTLLTQASTSRVSP